MTIKDAVDFIIQNRKNWAFKDLSKEAIASEVSFCGKYGAIAYAEEDGKLTGIVLCNVNRPKKILFVCNILCTTKKALLILCKVFEEKFVDFKLQEIKFKTGELKTYSKTSRYIRLLVRLNSKQES